MNEQELIALLLQNISYQLRHPNYTRTVEVGNDCRMMTTGNGQEKEVLKYRRWEAQELKKQRLRLNNPATPTLISEADILSMLTRVDGVRRDLKAANDKEKQELETALWEAFMPGVGLETWLVNRIGHLEKNDPNAWILYDRSDKRNPDGTIAKTNLRPVTFRAIDVLNFEYAVDGTPLWVLFRDFRLEYKIENGTRKDVRLETYYLYAPGVCIKAREAGEQTQIEPGETAQQIEVFPTTQSGNEREERKMYDHESGMKYERSTPLAYTTDAQTTKTFYISTITHGASEVPAFCVGAYPDEETDQTSFVSWFWPGMFVLKDVIRDKQMLDVAIVMQAYRRRSEFSPACDFETNKGEQCQKGWIYGGPDGRTRCPSCGGSGLKANFNTEQEVLRLGMPDGADPKDLLELSKLAFEEPVDTSLLEWFDGQLEKHRIRFNDAILGRETSTKPTGASTDTATAILKKTDAQADTLRGAGMKVSQGYELAFRVLADYREYGEILVNHSYPEKMDLLTLEQEIANMAAIQDVDIYEAKVAQRHKVLVKLFEGEPATHKRIAAWYRWLPFDDQSPEQLAQTLSMLSPTDYFHVLRTYWLQIRQEVEVKTPDFYLMSYEQQKAIIDAKVKEYQAKIVLAGMDTAEPPEFDSDNEAPTEENQNEQ